MSQKRRFTPREAALRSPVDGRSDTGIPGVVSPQALAGCHSLVGSTRAALVRWLLCGTSASTEARAPQLPPLLSELGAALRRLVDCRRLDSNLEQHPMLLEPFAAKLLDLAGGDRRLREAALHTRSCTKNMERVFDHGFFHGDAYRLGFERAQTVARIGKSDHEGVGSGVLVRGSDLHDSLGDGLFLLTCGHVVTPEGVKHPLGLRPDRAVALLVFGKDPSAHPRRLRVHGVRWYSGDQNLDTSLLRVSEVPEGLRPCPISVRGESVDRVYIAGYPCGGSLQFSLFDNAVVARNDSFLHYRAATDTGSSGSGVFDRDWGLVAIHHKGGTDIRRLDGPGYYAVNQGVRIDAIRAAIAAERG